MPSAQMEAKEVELSPQRGADKDEELGQRCLASTGDKCDHTHFQAQHLRSCSAVAQAPLFQEQIGNHFASQILSCASLARIRTKVLSMSTKALCGSTLLKNLISHHGTPSLYTVRFFRPQTQYLYELSPSDWNVLPPFISICSTPLSS